MPSTSVRRGGARVEIGLHIERISRPKRRKGMMPGADERIGDEPSTRWDRATARKQEEMVVEARLLARARMGDLDAFVQLINLHDRALRALAYRLLDDPQQMDDALQEAYLKAFRSLRGFEGRAAFGSWLHRIVYNVCMDQLRHRSGGGRPLSLWAAGEIPDPMPDPGEMAAQRLDLAAALASLPPKMRATVLLVDAEGMDYQTAAQVLGVPVGTVRSRLSVARGHLRRALSDEERGHDRS
jgi:RNA polymerase sigma-70 factor, ECF subfamily